MHRGGRPDAAAEGGSVGGGGSLRMEKPVRGGGAREQARLRSMTGISRPMKCFLAAMPERILGYSLSELTGGLAQWEKLVHAEDRGGISRRVHAEVLATQKPFNLEYRVRHRDGSSRHFLDKGHPLINSKGKISRALWVFRTDITARKRDEEDPADERRFWRGGYRNGWRSCNFANREMEAFLLFGFATILRAPLQSIRQVKAKLFCRKCGAKLDARGEEYLKRACESSTHAEPVAG